MRSILPDTTAWVRKNWVYAWVVVVFLASMVVAHMLGIRVSGNRFRVFWQYLDAPLLRDDLLGSLWNLHSQPPLFEVFLGVMLKLFPVSHRTACGVVFWVTGLFLLLGMAWVMRKCGVWNALNAALCTLFAFHPTFMVYVNWIFYTAPVATMLLATGAVLIKYTETGRTGWAHAFSWGCAAVMLTRSLYHPVWFVGLMLLLVLLVPRELRRKLLVCAVVPFIVVNAWYAKNLAQIGMYTSSSWIGMNLAHSSSLSAGGNDGWQLSKAELDGLVAAGKVPKVWLKGAFQEPDEYSDLGYFAPSNSIGLHEADGAPCTSHGGPNFNHREYARISQDMLKGAIALVREYPGRYLLRVKDGFMLFIQPGPNSTHFLVKYNFERVKRWKDITTRYLFLGKPYLTNSGKRPEPNILIVVYPMVLLYGAFVVLRKTASGGGTARIFIAFAVTTAIWAMACSIGLEVGENDRMRWETDPLVLIVGAHFIQAVIVHVRSRMRPQP
ncbi:MAG: hypothetical protein WCL44_10810 [bacterium]